VRFKSDDLRHYHSEKQLLKMIRNESKKYKKSKDKDMLKIMKNMEIIQSNHKKMRKKLVQNQKQYQNKLKNLKSRIKNQRSPSEKENNLIDQLKYNPKFDLLNREHLLNKNQFNDDEFKMVEKYKKLRDKMQKEFLKKNKNGLYGKGMESQTN
jgi:hypothetical protein